MTPIQRRWGRSLIVFPVFPPVALAVGLHWKGLGQSIALVRCSTDLVRRNPLDPKPLGLQGSKLDGG